MHFFSGLLDEYVYRLWDNSSISTGDSLTWIKDYIGAHPTELKGFLTSRSPFIICRAVESPSRHSLLFWYTPPFGRKSMCQVAELMTLLRLISNFYPSPINRVLVTSWWLRCIQMLASVAFPQSVVQRSFAASKSFDRSRALLLTFAMFYAQKGWLNGGRRRIASVYSNAMY